MTLSDLSERADVAQSELKRALSGSSSLEDAKIRRIAEELAVPARALFSEQSITLSSVPDFRREKPQETLLEPGVIRALGYVEKVSISLADLEIDLNVSDDLIEYKGELTRESAEILASAWREKWGISNDDQIEWKSASKVYYSLRSFIENLGVFVMHYQFGVDDIAGLYTKVDGGPPVILINTNNSSKARKLFTLAHEFCHVLLRKDGISNPSIIKNKIESFCNHFAACLIAPSKVIRKAIRRYGYDMSLKNDSVRLLATNLGISQQALVLRLVDMGIFQAKAYITWISGFKGSIPAGDTEDKGGGGGSPDPIKSKVTQYGISFLRKLKLAKDEGILDSIEIYRLYGIKPVYQGRLLKG